MKKLFLIILLFAGLTAFKQGNGDTRQISGTVYAKDDGLGIPGVTVKVDGTMISTQTNHLGRYHISVPWGSTRLSFSFIGYKPQSVPVGTKDTMNVYLEVSSLQLADVVVTGALGVKTQARQLGYSTATVTNQNLAAPPSPRVYSGLEGKAAGITVNKMVPARRNSLPGQYNRYNSPDNDESYNTITENTFNEVKSDPLSTFSVDVDAASYSNVRRFINNGELPPANAVRIEEMINYFKYNLPGPANGEPVAIHTELSSTPWNTKHRLLRIGLKAKTIDNHNLPPSNLVFLIDVSGSMDQANKLPLVKASMKMLTGQLRSEDKVAIVTYAGEAGVALESTSGDQKEKIIQAIDKLNASGSTNGGEGIKMAYRIARENFMKTGNNRIILATDGDFNVGPNSDEDMETLIVKERGSKVAISIMGFGMGNLKDSKMETMADKGNGNYAYIDNVTEATKALVTEFGGTLYTVAKDVKIQIEFNPAKVQAYRLLGYEDRMLAKEDFNNDRKDAGDMGSGHTVTALYEIVPAGIKDDYAGTVDPLKYQKAEPAPRGNGSDEMMTIKFRYKTTDSSPSKMSLVTVKDTPVSFNSASADLRFAAAVAEFGMLLRDSQFKQQASYEQVISIAKAAKGEDEDGYRSEFVRLAESAKLLAKTSLASN
jgi:Ca-activated chloride channel family protein